MATQSNTGFPFHNHYHHYHHHAQAISFESGTGVSQIITPPAPGNYYNHHHCPSTSSGRSRHAMLINPNIVNVSNNSMMTTAATPTAPDSMVYSGTPPPPPPPPPGGAAGGAPVITSCSSSSNNNSSGNSFGSLLLDTVPGLKHEPGLAVEWSVDEQYKLEEGLVKFADEPTIMKYIKIAAVLRDKTVRDVALRCRWMMRKWRKQEDHNLGKKVKDRRDRMESCLRTNTSSASPMNMAAYAIPLQPCDQSESTSPISALIGTTRHLLEENNQALCRISANLASLKMQDNVDLFLRIRSNLTSILNDMRNMPGIMSQMPPLPVFINEELTSSIFSSSTQCLMIGSSSGIHLKQEPGC